jgi:hypothetical protein
MLAGIVYIMSSNTISFITFILLQKLNFIHSKEHNKVIVMNIYYWKL